MNKLRVFHEHFDCQQDLFGAREIGIGVVFGSHEFHEVILDCAVVCGGRGFRGDGGDGPVDDVRDHLWLDLRNHQRVGPLEGHFERLPEESPDDVEKLVFDLTAGAPGEESGDEFPLVEVG